MGGALLVMNIMSYKLFEYVTNSYEYEQENMKLKEQMDIYEGLSNWFILCYKVL